MSIIIGCSIVSYCIGWAFGRFNLVRPYRPLSIVLIILISGIFIIPTILYLPILTPLPEGSEDPKPWIILGSMSMNAYTAMVGITKGFLKRL